jgi:competence ComEA-like helix-hairpin-helix protein
MFAHLFLALSLSLIGCVKRSRDTSLSSKPTERAAATSQTAQTNANDQTATASPLSNPAASQQKNSLRININTASAVELEKLPGIGKALAARIVEQREKYGPFRCPEHLIMVRGISDRRFRALRDLITAE